MSSRRTTRVVNVADAQRHAARILPAVLLDYIEGGADDEVTLVQNERAFRDLALRPRMGVDVGEPSLATTVLGTPLRLPVLLAPCGMVQLVHPDGAVGVARAASAAGTLAILSKTALCAPEEVAARSPGIHWFQLNSAGGRRQVTLLMEKARDAGFTGLVVTLDGPPPGNREQDRRHGVAPPIRVTPKLAARLAGQTLVRPLWTGRMLPALRRQATTAQGAARILTASEMHTSARFTWSDVEWMRGKWPGSLLVKGLLTGRDAVAARDAGADAIIVSNHGGRALDGAPAAIRALPEVVSAVGGSTEVLLDGGVRRATDVIKALCLGARAVLIGRPYLYGLAYAGQPGVERIIEIFHAELSRAMKLMGYRALQDLDTGCVAPMQWDQRGFSDANTVPLTELGPQPLVSGVGVTR